MELSVWGVYPLTMHDGGHSLQTDRRAQSATIGVVLVLAITLLGTGLVVGYGSQALNDTERVTTLSKAEHSMTQFDSQAAIVALGQSAIQRVDLGDSRGGTYAADDDAGWIRVVHRNATGDGTDTVLYNATLGSVAYENGDTTIGYQGGGVWRRDGNGSTMLSQPEFNYRSGTLTLPVIRIMTEDSAAGDATAFLRRANESRQVYPNRSKFYSDGRNYTNPVTQGSVAVTVRSEFYQGWATFFRTRTTGNVTVDDGNETATIELRTVGAVGDFSLTNALDDDGLDARGQEAGHSLESFSVDVEAEDQGNGFNNHYFSFYAESDNHRFEYLVHVPNGVNCNNGIAGESLVVKVFYRNTETGEQHEWSNSSVPADSGPIRLYCHSDGSTLSVDLTSSVQMTYGDTSSSGTYYDWSGSPVNDAWFNHTNQDGEDTKFEPTNQTTSNHLSRHYVALLGDDFTLQARSGTGGAGEGGGAQMDYGSSGGTLEYETGGNTYITYLHISENELEVEME